MMLPNVDDLIATVEDEIKRSDDMRFGPKDNDSEYHMMRAIACSNLAIIQMLKEIDNKLVLSNKLQGMG